MYYSRYHNNADTEAATIEQKKRRSSIMQKIVEILRASGAEVVLKDYTNASDTPSYLKADRTDFDIESINGEKITYNLNVKLDACYHDSPKDWSMALASCFTIGWRDLKFIEGKKGFKYNEIADAFIRYAAKKKEQREASNKLALAEESSRQLFNQLEKQFDMDYGASVRVSICQRANCVKLNTIHEFTLDNAVSLLNTIKAAGGICTITLTINTPVTEPVAIEALKWSADHKPY